METRTTFVDLHALIQRIKEEPVVVVDLIKAILVFLAAYNITITEAQNAAILGLAWAILTIFTRQQVTPVAKERRLAAQRGMVEKTTTQV